MRAHEEDRTDRAAAPAGSGLGGAGSTEPGGDAARHAAAPGTTVGLVGVGALGSGFAWNLIRAGLIVRGFDLDPQRLDRLVAWGGQATGSPAQAAAGARWVVTSLPEPADVRSVTLGPDGTLAGAAPGAVLVDTTTSSPDASRVLAEEVGECGHGFVDASVSGTGAGAMSGDIVLLVGGAAADADACRPLFDAIARRAYHLGPVGAGALAKLAVNVAVVGNRLALAEALSFGRAAGMDPGTLLSVLKDGPAYSRAMEMRGQKMVSRDYQPDSTLAASLRSAGVLLQEGQKVGAPLFLASLYLQIAQVAATRGFADSDAAAVIEGLLLMTEGRPRGTEEG
jgi:3-hydroxyisobutyrate dehydrogenase-like beta-hydroxyacid dehydrogenase